MTLNITIVAPWGVWQCSDHRVTWLKWDSRLRRWKHDRTDDFSVKHVWVRCRDGAALITYTGLGAVDLMAERDLHVSDWLRRTVRGRGRTVDETLIWVREEATAKLAGPARTAGVSHAFLVGAFLQRRPWVAVITNQEIPDGSPLLDRFVTSALPADVEPRLLVAGAGKKAISDDDWALLKRVTRHRPKRPEDYSQLLAEIHRRTKHSNHPARNTISEGCMTTFMPPSGDGLQSKTHWDASDPSGKTLPPAPGLLFGIDTTEIAKILAERIRAMQAGKPVDEDEFKRLTDEAGRRAVEPPTS